METDIFKIHAAADIRFARQFDKNFSYIAQKVKETLTKIGNKCFIPCNKLMKNEINLSKILCLNIYQSK